MSLNFQFVPHHCNQVVKHCGCGIRFALQIRQYVFLSVRRHHVHCDGVFLAEPPATPYALIILLVAVRREIGLVCTMLEVQSEPADDRLGDKHSHIAAHKSGEGFLFVFLAIFAGYFDSTIDRPRQAATFLV